MNTYNEGEFRAAYNAASSEAVKLHAIWNLIGDLYSDQENADIQTDSAALSFRFVQLALYETLIMKIALFLEGVRVCGQEVLSLKNIAASAPDSCKSELEAKAQQVRDSHQCVIDIRHNALAHRNKVQALDPALASGITTAQLDSAVEDIRKFLNDVAKEIGEVHVAYEYTSGIGDGKQMLTVLKMGLEMQELGIEIWKPETTLESLKQRIENATT